MNNIKLSPESVKKCSKVLYIPLYFAVFWMLLPFAVLKIAPYNLPINNEPIVIFYVILNALFFSLGYRSFCKLKNISYSIEDKSHRVEGYITLGFWLALILLPPSIAVYTGKSILDINSVLDQKAVYEDIGDVLSEESGARKLVSLVRGLAAPFSIASICLSAYYWPYLSRYSKILAVGTGLIFFIFSAFRGTDKETGDLLILSLVGLSSRLAYMHINVMPISKIKLIKYITGAFVLFIIFAALFVFRKSERLGGFVSFCFYADVACFETVGDSNILQILNFGTAMLSSYLVQGYYGLSLALDLDYHWTWGLGHSQPLQTIASIFVDSKGIYEQGLMAQLRTVGWDDKYVWSSIFPGWASDLTFYGVPFLFLIIGAVYGRSWASLIRGKSISAVVVFSLFTMLVLYIPANNQLTQSFDLYFTALFWLFAFSFSGVKRYVRK